MLGLEVLHQGLLLVISLSTFLAVVGKICTAAGLFVHVPGMARCKVLATFWTEIVGHAFMSSKVTPQCLWSWEILATNVTMDLVRSWHRNLKRQISSCCLAQQKRCRSLALQCKLSPLFIPLRTAFLMTTSSPANFTQPSGMPGSADPVDLEVEGVGVG